MKLSCNPIFIAMYINTRHTFNQCQKWFDSRSSDLRYIFPPKTRFVRGHIVHEVIELFQTLYLKILNEESKRHNTILHLRVIISRLYKGSQNQAVVMFQTGSSKNTIVRRF